MSQAASANRRSGERRVLIDRRSPNARVSGPERRDPLARRRGRRRRTTPSPYTVEQRNELQQAFAKPGSHTRCPECGGSFALSRARRRGPDTVTRIICLSCGKGTVVTNSKVARIMVIEENEIIRERVRLMLISAGHQVVEAADAEVGLWAYQNEPADLVLINALASGRMEAPDFIRLLLRESPDARVVAMSGRASVGFANPLALAMQVGATKTIKIPFSPTEILRTVQDVIQ